jgi:hypothetical protein
MNPKPGQFEAQAVRQMSDEDWRLYLDNAVILFAGSPATHQIPALSPDLFRSLMNVIRHCTARVEADLQKKEAKGGNTKNHICHDVRRLAWWATLQSFPIGSFLSERRYGIRPESL